MTCLRLLICGTAVMVSGLLKGQSELEIKTSGKYIYSWVIDQDLAKAREKARQGLLDTVYVSLLTQPAIDLTDSIFIKEINYFEKQIGFKWQAIAFADKSDIEIKMEQLKEIKVIPVIMADPSNSTPKAKANIPATAGTTDENALLASRKFDTGSPVLDQLLTHREVGLLKRELARLRADLKLNYGSKSNYPDASGCYIFVIDKESKLINAVYGKGLGVRKNLLTQAVENDYETKHEGSHFIYVVVN